MIEILRYLNTIKDWIIFFSAHVIPRNKRIWVFIGWRFSKDREIFSENPKYVFLQTAQIHKDIRPIWIGADRKICDLLKRCGYEAYPWFSFLGTYYSLRAGYTFISAYMRPHNWRLSGGSRVIQLWHGKSLKKTGFQTPYTLPIRNRFFSPQLFQRFYKFLAVSEFLGKFTVKDFNVPEDTLLVAGAPKYDGMLSRIPGAEIDIDQELESLLKKIKKQNFKRIIMYGPTFRPNGETVFSFLDLDKLNVTLQKTNDAIVMSLHPKFSLRDWIPKTTYSNIFFSQGDYDKYPLLNQFDLLISDYSSLSMDFLFLGKPVISFAYDKDTYDTDMGIYEELWDLMPGPKIHTFNEFLEVFTVDLSKYEPKIKRAREAFFGDYSDNQASERVVTAIEKLA